MSEEKPKSFSFNNPITWGIGLTIVLGCLVLFLGVQIGPDGKTRYKEFLGSPPNAIGDTLAGIFAPLAFIWIVVTVFLQSHELSEQRKELGLTREELGLARKAQEAQLSVMQKQADIFDDERRQRKENRASEQLDLILPWLAPRVAKFSNTAKASFKTEHGDKKYKPIFSHGSWIVENCKETSLAAMSRDFVRFTREFLAMSIDETEEERVIVLELSKQIQLDISKALSLRSQLSEAEQFRLNLTGLGVISECISTVEMRYSAGKQATP